MPAKNPEERAEELGHDADDDHPIEDAVEFFLERGEKDSPANDTAAEPPPG